MKNQCNSYMQLYFRNLKEEETDDTKKLNYNILGVNDLEVYVVMLCFRK